MKQNQIDIIISQIDWDKMDDLVPVITQDIFSKEILMQAYVNKQAIEATLMSGNATYWSRSRKQLWEKGLTSNTTQLVYKILTDCDADSILYFVEQAGEPPVACHTGKRSCFYNELVELKIN